LSDDAAAQAREHAAQSGVLGLERVFFLERQSAALSALLKRGGALRVALDGAGC
jgi:hypothetical protein